MLVFIRNVKMFVVTWNLKQINGLLHGIKCAKRTWFYGLPTHKMVGLEWVKRHCDWETGTVVITCTNIVLAHCQWKQISYSKGFTKSSSCEQAYNWTTHTVTLKRQEPDFPKNSWCMTNFHGWELIQNILFHVALV